MCIYIATKERPYGSKEAKGACFRMIIINWKPRLIARLFWISSQKHKHNQFSFSIDVYELINWLLKSTVVKQEEIDFQHRFSFSIDCSIPTRIIGQSVLYFTQRYDHQQDIMSTQPQSSSWQTQTCSNIYTATPTRSTKLLLLVYVLLPTMNWNKIYLLLWELHVTDGLNLSPLRMNEQCQPWTG